ncbi:MAG: MoxR family ATPase [Deltaproteobacteria bacterium]|nr:MoxR family ATPase [Deltaproteobacteria bacterium]
MDINAAAALADNLKREISKALIGQSQAVDLVLTSLVAGGHVLLEGVPGTGKTLLVQALAAAMRLNFGRIQFTPDMMPADILGTNLFNFQTNEFTLTPGPIFTQLLLADEINRTPPKTQAALLQAMNERKVTIDRQTFSLGEDFMVVATQNPIEQQGTYPLPEAQLDRFLFKVAVNYPDRNEEMEVVRRLGQGAVMPDLAQSGLQPVVGPDGLSAAREAARQVRLSDDLACYIVDLVRATRNDPTIETGASTRAATMLAAASRAKAALLGRDYVVPDDVKYLAFPLLRHRLVMTPSADMDGISPDQAVSVIISQVPAPR